MSNIFSFNGATEAGYSQPPPIANSGQARSTIPKGLLRKERAGWPTASEPEMKKSFNWRE